MQTPPNESPIEPPQTAVVLDWLRVLVARWLTVGPVLGLLFALAAPSKRHAQGFVAGLGIAFIALSFPTLAERLSIRRKTPVQFSLMLVFAAAFLSSVAGLLNGVYSLRVLNGIPPAEALSQVAERALRLLSFEGLLFILVLAVPVALACWARRLETHLAGRFSKLFHGSATVLTLGLHVLFLVSYRLRGRFWPDEEQDRRSHRLLRPMLRGLVCAALFAGVLTIYAIQMQQPEPLALTFLGLCLGLVSVPVAFLESLAWPASSFLSRRFPVLGATESGVSPRWWRCLVLASAALVSVASCFPAFLIGNFLFGAIVLGGWRAGEYSFQLGVEKIAANPRYFMAGFAGWTLAHLLPTAWRLFSGYGRVLASGLLVLGWVITPYLLYGLQTSVEGLHWRLLLLLALGAGVWLVDRIIDLETFTKPELDQTPPS